MGLRSLRIAESFSRLGGLARWRSKPAWPVAQKVRDAMAKTKDLPGVSGPITFDQNGDPTSYVMSGFLYKDGKYVWQRNISGDMTCQ